jgi:hypothetical protein
MASDPLQYYIGRGTLEIKIGGGAWTDLGNVPTFEITPTIEKLEHKSSRTGIRSTDRSVVVEKGGTVRIIIEEYNYENLQLALLGGDTTDGSGNSAIDILSENSITAQLRFTGANDVGPKLKCLFHSVTFNPSGTFGLLSDEFGQMEVQGDIAVNGDGSFGWMRIISAGA